MLKKLVLLVASTLFSVVLIEVGVRGWFWSKGIGRTDVRDILQRSQGDGPVQLEGGSGLFGIIQASEHDDIVYQLKPHLEGVFKGAPVEINPDGFRGPQVSLEKPEGVRRIVGIGDSHMFGWGVGNDETYLSVLESRLNREDPGKRKWQVLNFAVPGYNTKMEVATFEKRALAYDPDLVIIHFIGNDFAPPHFLDTKRSIAPSQWYSVELLRGLLLEPEEDTAIAFDPDTNGGDTDPGEADAPLPGSRQWYEKDFGGREVFVAAMDRLAGLSREHDVPVITLILGSHGQVRQFVLETARERGFYTLDAAEHWWRAIDAMGLERTQQNWKEQLGRGVERHPKAAGHAAYSDALFDAVVEVLPPPAAP